MYAWQCASKTTQVTLLLHVANLRLLWMLICLLTFEKCARTSSSSRSITMVQQKEYTKEYQKHKRDGCTHGTAKNDTKWRYMYGSVQARQGIERLHK